MDYGYQFYTVSIGLLQKFMTQYPLLDFMAVEYQNYQYVMVIDGITKKKFSIMTEGLILIIVLAL